MLCLIVGREGRRERRWWASSYQVSPNTVSCVLAHLHISIPTHPHTYSSPPTSSYPHAHPHTYTSSHPHIPISDSFYQPLSAQCHSLPRSHKVKVARKEVNDTVQLSRIPDYDGSYRQVEVAVSEEISKIVLFFTYSWRILVQSFFCPSLFWFKVDTYLDLEALLN